jgi:hypothetical protein
MGMSGQRHAPSAPNPRVKDHGTHCTGGWVGPGVGLDTEARGKSLASAADQPRLPGRPVRSQTQHCAIPAHTKKVTTTLWQSVFEVVSTVSL